MVREMVIEMAWNEEGKVIERVMVMNWGYSSAGGGHGMERVI